MQNHHRLHSSLWFNARNALGVVFVAAIVSLALPMPAGAQEPGTFVRLYYSSWMNGEVQQSPADPVGQFADGEELGQNIKAELEAIFLRRLGVAFSRQKLHRTFHVTSGAVAGCVAPSCLIQEDGVLQSVNLTLYGREVAHDQFNLFVGGGAGEMDYGYTVDGVRQTNGELYDNLSLSRWFLGIEYTFERIGFRIEVSTARAHKTLPQATPSSAEVEGAFQYLTLVIPLN